MDYFRLCLATNRNVSAFSATGGALSAVAGRISYIFDLKGASLSIDTACSSSLVSLHLALSQIRMRRMTEALNSGVNLTLLPDVPAMFQRAGMMSPGGRCKTLDAAADGYVRGEAVVTALLQAQGEHSAQGTKDGSASWCLLVRGSAVNQGGRSSTLTAPNGPSQQDVLRNALQDAGASPDDIFGLQMHGTGRLHSFIAVAANCEQPTANYSSHNFKHFNILSNVFYFQERHWEIPSRLVQHLQSLWKDSLEPHHWR